ncbi:MAG TPA: metal ABC transporter permease [Coleofasciculaceae cyanobacterium]|jgi:zinc/manganese transport system permease protein
MLEMFQLPFMQQAFIACLLMAAMLSYFGVHVVTRGIVFIDLALAQISSVGVAFAVLTGGDPRLYAVLFTLAGALGLSLIQSNHRRVPQEAIIGIIYAVASAVSMLLIAKTPHGDSDVTAVLFGNILAVSPQQIIEIAIVFGLVGVVHFIFRRRFSGLMQAYAEDVTAAGNRLNPWNILFYLSLALVISEAVSAAGVLQVFAYLIVPAVCALLLFQNASLILLAAFVIGLLASLGGLYTSYAYDLPTGTAIVAGFGVLFLLSLGLSALRGRRP